MIAPQGPMPANEDQASGANPGVNNKEDIPTPEINNPATLGPMPVNTDQAAGANPVETELNEEEKTEELNREEKKNAGREDAYR